MISGDDQNNDPGTKQWSFEQSDLDFSLLGRQEGAIFVGNGKGNLYAIDATTGTEELSLELADGELLYPTVEDKTMYVGSTDHSLYKVDLDNGIAEWSFKTGGWIGSSPRVVDGTVLVGSHDNNLYAVDLTTGIEEWSFETGDWILPSPTVANGTVYMLSMDNTLYAIDAATGSELWSYDIDVWVGCDMVVDGTVYIGSTDNNLYAVDTATGTQQWSFDTEGTIITSPIVADETVYVGNAGGRLSAVNSGTGTGKWSFEAEGGFEAKPRLYDGTVYIGSLDSYLYAVDAGTGTEKWSFDTEDRIRSSATVIDGTVYFGSTDHNMYAVDATSGTQKWSFDTRAKIRSPPYVLDGVVYVKSTDGSLHAITASERSANDGNQRRSKTDEELIPPLEEMHSPKRRTLSFDEFETIEVIVGGGQAVIKKARLTNSKDPPELIAVRQLPASSTITIDAIEEFLKRAEIWKTIDDRERDKPNRWGDYEHIVGVIDTGEEPFPWIAMEYMDGGDLSDLLEEHPDGLPVGQALWIGECVCKGLEIANKLGKCHLDVKPKNVLLKETDGWPWPKLADWGVARNLAQETGTMSAWSPEYAAPEQLDPSEFGDPDQLTDIYQTGALMYALLTGDPLVSESSIEPPSERRPKLSSKVDAAVGLALERQKLDRYDSIADFRKALNAIRTDERLPREVARRVEN